MSQCNYARKVSDGKYEYGYLQVTGAGTKNEKREYIALGHRPSLDEALAANNMALNGLPRKGYFLQPLIYGGPNEYQSFHVRK